jgi:hypothetical protein
VKMSLNESRRALPVPQLIAGGIGGMNNFRCRDRVVSRFRAFVKDLPASRRGWNDFIASDVVMPLFGLRPVTDPPERP